MKTNQIVNLNGQQYEVIDQIRAGCGCCDTMHNIILLSRDFPFTIGGFGFRVKHECYYCSITGELFVDKRLKNENQRRINEIVFPHRRGTSINT